MKILIFSLLLLRSFPQDMREGISRVSESRQRSSELNSQVLVQMTKITSTEAVLPYSPNFPTPLGYGGILLKCHLNTQYFDCCSHR